jgi:hypothetical protein
MMLMLMMMVHTMYYLLQCSSWSAYAQQPFIFYLHPANKKKKLIDEFFFCTHSLSSSQGLVHLIHLHFLLPLEFAKNVRMTWFLNGMSKEL